MRTTGQMPDDLRQVFGDRSAEQDTREEMRVGFMEIRIDFNGIRSEFSALRSEVHDMNGRLGHVEGLLRLRAKSDG